MSFCKDCGSRDVLELTIEKDEAWYYCYTCKACYGDSCRAIPLEVFVQELRDQGFPKDADHIARGERASLMGE